MKLDPRQKEALLQHIGNEYRCPFCGELQKPDPDDAERIFLPDRFHPMDQEQGILVDVITCTKCDFLGFIRVEGKDRKIK